MAKPPAHTSSLIYDDRAGDAARVLGGGADRGVGRWVVWASQELADVRLECGSERQLRVQGQANADRAKAAA